MSKIIFTVIRTDEVGYDEAAGYVIVAASAEEARNIASSHRNEGWKDDDGTIYDVVDWSNAEVRVIGSALSSISRIVLQDYRAG